VIIVPIRSTRSRKVGAADVAALRQAIRAGYPWLLHTGDDIWRHTGLNTQQNIMLAYVTGISSGVAVFLAGEPHPSKEIVAAVKAELQVDIDAAERRFRKIFKGHRYRDSFFRSGHAAIS
jgi:hypothetical protein